MNENRNGRAGVLVDPISRLDRKQVELVHETSTRILEEIGITCHNREAAELFEGAGARTTMTDDGERNIRIPRRIVEDHLKKAPSRVVLGARNPENRLILDAGEPRVRFGSGSEANIYLEMEIPGEDSGEMVFRRLRGSVELLCEAARLCQQLDNLDFFIRTVNIQDTDISDEDKDVNKFFASANNIDKHIMAGLTSLQSLEKVLHMGELITGGKDELRENPVFSFITCVAKSPLQFVDDTTQKMIEIVRSGMPVAISSSPQGGSTAPIQEAGMVSQINAEIIAGITLSQIAAPGAGVLYGSVPVRARMDDLQDLYGAPEFCQYNVDCIQMARFYGLPSYSTAGVGDAKVPGVQATVEKLFSHLMIPMAGAQYVHYAFGLLEKTNVFSPDQAVLDNEQIGIVKHILKTPEISIESLDSAFNQIREVMDTSHKLYSRYTRKGIRDGSIYLNYPFETKEERDLTLLKAHMKRKELLQLPTHHIEEDLVEKIYSEVPGLVDRINPYS